MRQKQEHFFPLTIVIVTYCYSFGWSEQSYQYEWRIKVILNHCKAWHSCSAFQRIRSMRLHSTILSFTSVSFSHLHEDDKECHIQAIKIYVVHCCTLHFISCFFYCFFSFTKRPLDDKFLNKVVASAFFPAPNNENSSYRCKLWR